MHTSHYLFIGDINRYREAKNTDHQGEFERLITQSKTYFGTKLSKDHPLGSSTFMAFAELNLSLSYLLTNDVAYLTEAKRWITALCGYEKWGHSHMVNVDLSASWNLFGLALCYDWLRDDLDPSFVKMMEDKLKLQAHVLSNWAIENSDKSWAVEYLQNHNWINFTGLAAAGYALKNTTYINMSKENFAKVFPLLNDDGSDYEGVVYWRYGAMWLYMYAALLKAEEGFDYFEKSKFLHNTFYYRLYQSAPDLSRQVNFGDCHDTHSGHPACIYRLVAKEYHDGIAQTYASYILDNFLEDEINMSKVKPGIGPEAFLEYIWYDSQVKEEKLETLPLFKEFPDLGLITLRSSWKDDAKVFSYKCGYPGGKKQWLDLGKMKEKTGIEYRCLSHNHPDHLSYIIINGNTYFTAEDGYNREIMEYHHSSLLVDGKLCDVHGVNDVYIDSFKKRVAEVKPQNNEALRKLNESYKAEITDLSYADGLLSFHSSATALYPLDLQMKEVSRFVVSDNATFIAFFDVFDSAVAHTYSALCNTYEKAIQEEGTFTYDYKKSGISYHVVPLDGAVSSQQRDYCVSSVMTTQEPDKKCSVNLQNLSHTSQKPSKHFELCEVFCFDKNLKVTHTDNHVQIGNYIIDKQTVKKGEN